MRAAQEQRRYTDHDGRPCQQDDLVGDQGVAPEPSEQGREGQQRHQYTEYAAEENKRPAPHRCWIGGNGYQEQYPHCKQPTDVGWEDMATHVALGCETQHNGYQCQEKPADTTTRVHVWF